MAPLSRRGRALLLTQHDTQIPLCPAGCQPGIPSLPGDVSQHWASSALETSATRSLCSFTQALNRKGPDPALGTGDSITELPDLVILLVGGAEGAPIWFQGLNPQETLLHEFLWQLQDSAPPCSLPKVHYTVGSGAWLLPVRGPCG